MSSEALKKKTKTNVMGQLIIPVVSRSKPQKCIYLFCWTKCKFLAWRPHLGLSFLCILPALVILDLKAGSHRTFFSSHITIGMISNCILWAQAFQLEKVLYRFGQGYEFFVVILKAFGGTLLSFSLSTNRSHLHIDGICTTWQVLWHTSNLYYGM